jgi:hypothetical protein
MGKLLPALASKRRTAMLYREEVFMSGYMACMLTKWQAR